MSWSRRLIILAIALAPPVCVVVGFGNASDIMMVGGVAFSPDDRELATVCYPQRPQPHAELRVWDLATGEERRSERRALPDPLLSVVDNGERLVARAVDGGTRPLSELARWPERILLGARVGGIGCLATLSLDGRTLATARHRVDLDKDTRVRIWDVATGRLIKTLDDGQLVDMLAFSPDSHILAGVRGRLAAWDVGSGSVLGWSKAVSSCVAPLTFSPDGSALAIQASGSKLSLLDAANGRVRTTFNYAQADALAFSPDGRRLAVADDERVTVWDLGSSRPIVGFEGHVRPRTREIFNHIRTLARGTGSSVANAVWSVAFSPDGRLAASCDVDGTARVWDAAMGRERLCLDHRFHAPFWPLAAACIWTAAWGIIALRGWRPMAERP